MRKKHHLSDKLIQRLIVPLTEEIFFLPLDEYSAKAFFGLYSPAVLRWPTIRAGAFRGGMIEVLADKIGDEIIRRGGEIKKNVTVDKIILKDQKVVGVEISENIIYAENVILATQLSAQKKIISNSFPEFMFKNILSLPTMPTVTIQFDLKAPSMPKDHATFSPGTVLAFYAEQSRTTIFKWGCLVYQFLRKLVMNKEEAVSAMPIMLIF